MSIDKKYAAFILIEILFEKGLINKATYNNVNNYRNMYIEGCLHISQTS